MTSTAPVASSNLLQLDSLAQLLSDADLSDGARLEKLPAWLRNVIATKSAAARRLLRTSIPATDGHRLNFDNSLNVESLYIKTSALANTCRALGVEWVAL